MARWPERAPCWRPSASCSPRPCDPRLRSMRISSLEVIPYALPFERPYVTSRGRLESREMVLVRLRTDEGLEGLGEAVPLSLRGGAALPAIVHELRESIAPAIVGIDLDGDPTARNAPIANGLS